MKFRPGALRPTAMALALLIAALPACSKKSTNPPPGGALELNSGTLNPGNQYVHTFNTPGTFPYHCNFHGGMQATVTVGAGGLPGASISITDNAFTPASVTVTPGSAVTWTNNGGNQHTVTSH
jgi:plastocyanin